MVLKEDLDKERKQEDIEHNQAVTATLGQEKADFVLALANFKGWLSFLGVNNPDIEQYEDLWVGSEGWRLREDDPCLGWIGQKATFTHEWHDVGPVVLGKCPQCGERNITVWVETPEGDMQKHHWLRLINKALYLLENEGYKFYPENYGDEGRKCNSCWAKFSTKIHKTPTKRRKFLGLF